VTPEDLDVLAHALVAERAFRDLVRLELVATVGTPEPGLPVRRGVVETDGTLELSDHAHGSDLHPRAGASDP
jgi:hypothetical protein